MNEYKVPLSHWRWVLVFLPLLLVNACNVNTGWAPIQHKRPHPPRCMALLLPQSGPHAQAAQSIQNGFFTAYYQAKQKSGTRIKLYDTGNGADPIQTASAYQQALKEGADLVVGPLTKIEVESLLQSNGRMTSTEVASTTLPSMLALNTIQPQFRAPSHPLMFFSLNPEDEARSVAEHAVSTQLKRALIIAPKGEWGQRMIQAFKSRLEELQGQVSNTEFIHNIQQKGHWKQQLERAIQEYRGRFDFIFLASNAEFVEEAMPWLRTQLEPQIKILGTSHAWTPGRPNPALAGLELCDIPWLLDQGPQSLTYKLAQNNLSQPEHAPRLFAMGIDAFLIAQAPESSLRNGVWGMTGHLQLTPNQQIQRKLIWASLAESGQAVLLNH